MVKSCEKMDGTIKHMTKSAELQNQNRRLNWLSNDRAIPIFLLILTLLTYAPLIRSLGFYWDDWPMLWFDITQGPQGFAQAFTSDRPFLGYLYQFTGAVVGTDPLNWQIVAVLFRWLVSWAFWWMLRQLWPRHADETLWMTILLTVYSGFKQMPVAYVWSNALIMLFAYILSYGMMLKAIRSAESADWKGYWVWTIAGVLCYAFCTVSTEYYTGLDLVRGVVIWIFLLNFADFTSLSFLKKCWKTLFYWIPYLAVLAIFMFWRVFIFKFPSYQPVLLTELAENPLRAAAGLLSRVVNDFYTATWGAWIEFFRFPGTENLKSVSDKLFWLFVLIGFALVWIVARFYRKNQDRSTVPENAQKDHWVYQALALGALAVIFPGIPYLITSLSPALDFPRDRWLSAYMFGSSILLVGLCCWLIQRRSKRILWVSLFAAFAIGGNFLNANSFRRDWENQQDFVQQLTTRIPDFEQPLFLLTDFNPLSYETDNSLTGMVNLALSPENKSLTLPVSVGFYDVRFQNSTERLENEQNLYQGFRSANFQGTVEDVVVYFYSPPGCLRILDSAQHSTLPLFPESFSAFMRFSNPKKIYNAGDSSDFLWQHIFKRQPAENWCTWFQRADLARQSEDWESIARIGDQVLGQYDAAEASEYIPFVEAYIHLDRWEDALPLIAKIHGMNKSLDAPLCPILQKLFVDFLPEDQETMAAAAGALHKIGCSAYNQ